VPCGVADRISVDLTHPVDVYNEWLDACEAVNNPKPAKPAAIKRPKAGKESHVDKPETLIAHS
jgi:transcription elongation factor Elf1